KDCPTHHRPVCRTRPTISSLPSPLKSPTWTLTQVTSVLHVSQTVKLNELLPVLSPVHHRPVSSTRPVMSALPSPLKSPTLTSTQLTAVGQAEPPGAGKKVLPPMATHPHPRRGSRPPPSAPPSPPQSRPPASPHSPAAAD